MGHGISLNEKIPQFLANAIPDLSAGATSWSAWGKVSRFFSKIREHACKKKIHNGNWLLSDYLNYHRNSML